MEITQKEENGILFFTIVGRLDADSSPEAEKVVHDALEGQTTRVLFDLASLEYLSSAGLRAILSASKEIKSREGKMMLAGLAQYVYEIFEISGFTSLIPIKETVVEALKDLAS